MLPPCRSRSTWSSPTRRCSAADASPAGSSATAWSDPTMPAGWPSRPSTTPSPPCVVSTRPRPPGSWWPWIRWPETSPGAWPTSWTSATARAGCRGATLRSATTTTSPPSRQAESPAPPMARVSASSATTASRTPAGRPTPSRQSHRPDTDIDPRHHRRRYRSPHQDLTPPTAGRCVRRRLQSRVCRLGAGRLDALSRGYASPRRPAPCQGDPVPRAPRRPRTRAPEGPPRARPAAGSAAWTTMR